VPRFARLAERLQIPDTRAWRVVALACAVLLPVGIAALFLLDPEETSGFPRCPVFALTGWKCPGCGTARALHAALHGRLADALRLNAALPVAFALVAFAVAFPRRALRPAFAWAVLALVVAWGVARNVLGM
jgi:hypothetical protein